MEGGIGPLPLSFHIEYDGAVLEQDDPAFKMSLHRLGQNPALDVFSHVPQTVGAEFVVHPHDILVDDRPLVEILACIVGCRPDHLYSAFICLPIRIRALEGRKESMMDVDDFCVPLAGEIRTEDLHIPGQDNQVDVKALKQCHYLGLLLGLRFGSDRQIVERNSELVGDYFQVRMIADDQGDIALQVAFILAGDQVVQAVAGLADHDGNPGVIVAVVAFPRQVVLLGKPFEVLFKLLSGGLEILHVQFNAHEVATLDAVGVLLAVYDIVAALEKPR